MKFIIITIIIKETLVNIDVLLVFPVCFKMVSRFAKSMRICAVEQ